MKLTAERIIGFIILLIVCMLGFYIVFVKDIPGTLVIPTEFRWVAGIILFFTGLYVLYVIWPDEEDEYEEIGRPYYN